jgi:hypothetical protein
MNLYRRTTLLVLALSASYASAADKKAPAKKKGASPAQSEQPVASPAADTSSTAATNNAKPRADEPALVTSTKFDFESASIDGMMKAPLGFMLHGRTSTSQVNMIELRTNFRNELRDSKAAVMAIGAPP